MAIFGFPHYTAYFSEAFIKSAGSVILQDNLLKESNLHFPPIPFHHLQFAVPKTVIQESAWGADTCFLTLRIFCINKLLLLPRMVYLHSWHSNLLITLTGA